MAHLMERAYLLRHQQKDNRLKVLTSKAPGIPDINFINLRKLKAVFTLEATGVFKEGPLDWWFRYSRFGPIIWMLNSSWVVECILSLFYCSHCFFHTLYISIVTTDGFTYYQYVAYYQYYHYHYAISVVLSITGPPQKHT